MIGGFGKLVNPPSFVSEVDLDATREARATVHEEVAMRTYIEQLIATSAPGTGAVTIKPMEIDFVEVDSFEDEEECDSDDPGPVAA